MAVYPEFVNQHSLSPKHAGTAARANAAGTAANFTCGTFVRFSLHIDPVCKQILDIGFVSSGCGFAVAAAEILSENVSAKSLTEFHGFGDTEADLFIDFGDHAIPAERAGCREMVVEAFKIALADFRSRQIEEFRVETALICTCFGVSEETIEKIISDHSPKNAEEVAALCNAGGGCGSCRMLIQSMIDAPGESLRKQP